jgi:hypothetical protein
MNQPASLSRIAGEIVVYPTLNFNEKSFGKNTSYRMYTADGDRECLVCWKHFII